MNLHSEEIKMECEIWKEATVSEELRDLIHRHRYEDYVFQIIKKSKHIFNNCCFEQCNMQSNGESDFIDINSKKKYEVKLIFDEKVGALIGERKNDLTLGIERLLEQSLEYGNLIRQGESDISQSRVYQIVKKRLSTIENDETAILFIPFPLVEDSMHDVFSQYATDFIQAIYKQLDKDELTDGREIFFIYPATETGFYCIRNQFYNREYVSAPELNKIVSYSTQVL